MKNRIPREKLQGSEIERARALSEKVGADTAARQLGVGVVTLRKALLGEAVHRLTATTIRSHLSQTI